MTANLFAKNPFAEVCNSGTTQEIDAFFQKTGITHILVSQKELDRLGGVKTFGFSQRGEKRLAEFLGSKTTPIFSHNDVVLGILKFHPDLKIP
jgi:hypothetical protein